MNFTEVLLDEKKGGLCMKKLDFSGGVIWRGIYFNRGTLGRRHVND